MSFSNSLLTASEKGKATGGTNCVVTERDKNGGLSSTFIAVDAAGAVRPVDASTIPPTAVAHPNKDRIEKAMQPGGRYENQESVLSCSPGMFGQ